MAISQATRTHLTYQFIILTLLFLSIGYNELLPDRKFIIFLGFGPIFCYQLIILLCCMEFMPVPSWMSFLNIQENKTSSENSEKDFPSYTSRISSRLQTKNTDFPEVEERMPYIRRWEKSVTNLRTPPKHFDYPQKSKSWMNLSDSKSLDRLSTEGSVDSLTAFSDKKRSSKAINKEKKARHRGERAAKAKSWKPGAIFDFSDRKEFSRTKDLPLEELPQQTELPLGCTEIKQEESELSKSYSFPFRQKRLETWLEMKETNVSDTTKSPSMPYWQTVGYNLAVKYEARRRRRAMSNPRTESSTSEEQSQKFQTSTEIEPESAIAEKPNAIAKKSAKTATACMNKIKLGFSNLISKKKEDGFESSSSVLNKVGKSPLLFKLKNKNPVGLKEKDKCPPAMPEFPQFLGNERPLIFYPKYIPFEKERFENDVKKKMLELSEEQQKENIKPVI